MSTSPPWMPLHIGDYLRDTGHLSVVEHGAYLLLIMRYWQDGGLPADEILIARYAHLTAEQWSLSRPVLVALFDEGWKHKRIDAELEKAAEIIGKRKAAGQQRQSTRSAHAEQVDSTSSYTGVPPSPLPEPREDKPAPSVPDAEGARDLFADLWIAFPQNPTSSESAAMASFRATKAKDHELILAAAQRYAMWFAEDNEARDRTVDAGLRYVPHLAKWLDSGDWKKAAALPVRALAQPDPDLAVVPADSPDFIAITKLRGKAPFVGKSGSVTVRKDELERARSA